MSAAPFMPLYIGDYLADTVHLNGVESGAYLHLLMGMWRSGGALPYDHAKLARYCKLTRAQWDRVAPAVLPFFDVLGDTLTNHRLAAELQKYEVALTRRVERASAGGIAKALKNKKPPLLRAEHKRANQNQNHKEESPDAYASVEPTAPKLARRLADEWEPDKADREFAAQLGLTPEEIDRGALEFRNYWTGLGGSKSRKLNWPRTWQNRCLEIADRKRRFGPRLAVVAGNAQTGGRSDVSFADLILRRDGEAANRDPLSAGGGIL